MLNVDTATSATQGAASQETRRNRDKAAADKTASNACHEGNAISGAERETSIVTDAPCARRSSNAEHSSCAALGTKSPPSHGPTARKRESTSRLALVLRASASSKRAVSRVRPANAGTRIESTLTGRSDS